MSVKREKETVAPKESTFTFWELESQIFELEGVRVIFRADPSVRLKGVAYKDFYKNAAAQNSPLLSLRKRIEIVLSSLVNDIRRGDLRQVEIEKVHFHFIDGTGNHPNQKSHIGTVRKSYKKPE